MAELILALSILMILLLISTASYETLKARIRAAKAIGDMDALAKVGYTDFTNTFDWCDTAYDGVDTDTGDPVKFISEGLLKQWPQAPCPNFYYSWENWVPLGHTSVRVTLRNGSSRAVWSYCVNVLANGNCEEDDILPGVPIEISTNHVKYLYCNE